MPKTLNPHKPHCPKPVTIQESHSDSSSDSDSESDPLNCSLSSDEDEWGGNSSNHYVIALISDIPTVIVHAGKRFKAVIDSGAALSLVCTSVYSMIEDCYKTKMVPATVNLKTVDRSAMSSLGKATLHLCIANFKFSHMHLS